MNINNSYEDFQKKVLKIVSEIPRGKVLSYKEVAKRAGWKIYAILPEIPEIDCKFFINSI